ncbi:hypothetical protein [uncultured Marinobacter sp.]|mgnify:FL=1|uniref:hypothetical protein n=1 Tax=uncultured Marinobacter sp. TaxID=187379 RepID=UPI0030DA2674
MLDHLAAKLGLELSSELKAEMAKFGRVNINSFADTPHAGNTDRNQAEIIGLLPGIFCLATRIAGSFSG